MRSVIIFSFLLHSLFTSCNGVEPTKSFYESGNLKKKYFLEADTLHEISYYDSTVAMVQSYKKIVNDTLVEICYLSRKGEIIFSTRYESTKVELRKDSTETRLIHNRNTGGKLLSVRLNSLLLPDYFGDFFNSVLPSDGTMIHLDSYSSSENELGEVALLFETNIKMLNDSLASLQGTHSYFRLVPASPSEER